MKLPTGKDLFYIAAIVVLIIILLTKNWQCKPKDYSGDKALMQEQKRIRDSAVRANDSKEFRFKQDSSRWQKEKDAYRIRLAEAHNQLSSSQRKTAELSAAVKISKINKDTASYVKACDSLAEENANLAWLINEYIVYADTVAQKNDSLLAITQTRKQEVDSLNKMLLAQANKGDSLYNNLYKSYQKVSNKSAKRFTIGPGVTYGVGVDGRLQAVIGISATWRIIRF